MKLLMHVLLLLAIMAAVCCYAPSLGQAQLLPLQDMRTFATVNGLLDIVLVAKETQGPGEIQIEGAAAPPNVWVYDVCPRLSADQFDCAGVPQPNPFYGVRLEIQPGDRLKIRLVNRLPPSEGNGPTRTNLHFHGQLVDTHSVGGTFGDYVLVECFNSLVEPEMKESSDATGNMMRKDFIDYDLLYRAVHPPGLFWFHPHNHMGGAQNQQQINAGLSGVVTVGTIAPVPAAEVQHLLLRTTFVQPTGELMINADPFFCDAVPDEDAAEGFCPGVPGPTVDNTGGKIYFTVNGQVFPTLVVEGGGGGGQVWRITQSMASITSELKLINDADGTLIPFQVLAVDGVSVEPSADGNGYLSPGTCDLAVNPDVLCAEAAFMMPSTRADLYIAPMLSTKGTTNLTATLLASGPLMGPGGDDWPSAKIARVVFLPPQATTGGGGVGQQETTPLHELTKGYQPYMNDTDEVQLPCAHPLPEGHRRRISMGVPQGGHSDEESGGVEMPGDFGLQYAELDANGKVVRGTQTLMSAFDPFTIMVCARLGATEQWEIINVSQEDHNFHIHQAKFRVLNQTSEIEPENRFVGSENLVDTVPIQPGNSAQLELFFAFSGDYMLHCHIAEHSNNGMMARIRVTNNIVSEPLLNTAIMAIVIRELVEMAILVLSHVGTVVRSPLRRERKFYYLKGLGVAYACGLVLGMIISVAVGFGLAAAAESAEAATNGMIIGEAVSKTIAGYFVASITLKIPRWFGISNYVKPGEENKRLAIEQGSSVEDLGMKRGPLAMSLFWNALRETVEGGVLTGLTYLFSTASLDTLGASVGVGIGVAVAVSVVFGLGAAFFSRKLFGVLATALTILLSIGLVTGAVREWEELFDLQHGYESASVYFISLTTTEGATLNSLEAIGVSNSMTQLTISTLFITLFVLIVLNVWHNYYGREVYNFTYCARRAKRATKRCCKRKTELQQGERKEDAAAADDEENSASVSKAAAAAVVEPVAVTGGGGDDVHSSTSSTSNGNGEAKQVNDDDMNGLGVDKV